MVLRNPTIPRFSVLATTFAVLALALGLVQGARSFWAGKAELQAAKVEAARARQTAVNAVAFAVEAINTAEAEKAKAEAAEKASRRHKAEADQAKAEVAALGAAPDTCAPWIEGLQTALDSETARGDSLEVASAARVRAAANLRAALDSVTAANDSLLKANRSIEDAADKLIRRTFWDKVLPEVGVGAAAGVDAEGEPNVVVGVTLSYRLR